MCIRDRNYTAITQHILGIRPTFDGLKIDPAIPADWDGFTAVSYTHLRAHETVLDLVCRLLLEKKKSQTHT